MKIIQYTIRGLVITMTLCFLARGTFAYAPETTHAGLTQEIISYYNTARGNVLDDTTAELLIQGSIDEDTPSSRCLNHFYDPVHNIGLNDGRSSPEWATNNFTGNSFTWSQGIEAYARGDTRRSAITLGHILHLVEDASVPDHTRNDPHMGDGVGGLNTGGSPLEGWTSEHKDRASLVGVGKKLEDAGVPVSVCADIIDCFEFMAGYSNGNFFSRDTVSSTTDFKFPKITRLDDKYAYGNDSILRQEEKLLVVDRDKENKLTFSLSGIHYDDYSVISDYFDRLTPQVIPVGARVIDLYLAEAKTAREKYLAEQEAMQAKAVAKEVALHQKLNGASNWELLAFGFTHKFITTPIRRIARAVDTVTTLSVRSYSTLAMMANKSVNTYAIVGGSGIRGGAYAANVVVTYGAEKAKEGRALATEGVAVVVDSAVSTTETLADLIVRLNSARTVLAMLSRESTPEAPARGEVLGDTTSALNASGPAPAFVGGGVLSSPAEPKEVIVLGVAQGSVPIPYVPPPPPEAPNETTTTGTGDETASASDEVASTTPDTMAPDAPIVTHIQGETFQNQGFPLDIATTSLSVSGTAEAKSIVTISWKNGATTYLLVFATGEDGAWSYDIILSEGETTLTFVAEDASGNVSSETTIPVVVSLPPPPPAPILPVSPLPGELFINEVAWGGTYADPSDEWIELVNTTGKTLDLSGVTLRSEDGGLLLQLFGTLSPKNFLLLARFREDGRDSVSSVANPLFLPWGEGLSDGGEHLMLSRVATGTETGDVALDDLPLCADWCGVGEPGMSMERWRYDRPTGDYAGNWKTDTGDFDRGTDSAGDIIAGTPGARNGANHLLSLGNSISSDLILTAEEGGYFVDGNNVILLPGTTLAMDPGVVIKYRSYTKALLTIRGVLRAIGNSEAPIIFTTSEDDRFGGDLFSDGTPSGLLAPAGGIDLYSTSAGSIFENVAFYNLKTGPYFDRTSATMTSVTIADSREGIELYKSVVDGSDLLFRNTSANDAIQIYGGSTLTLASTTIIGVSGGNDAIDANKAILNATDTRIEAVGSGMALRLQYGTSTIDGLTIGDTTGSPEIYVYAGNATISDATLSGGSSDGIAVYGGASLTLASSTVEDFSRYGIVVAGASSLAVASSTISDNGTGIKVWSGSVDVTDSVITGNGVGITNSDPARVVSATENYWGDPSGPTLPGGTPAGDSVSVNVTVEPFLTEAP